jgi:hypothetical protein
MREHRDPPAADLFVHDFQDPVWSIARPGRRLPLRARVIARVKAPWLDEALATGADPSASPALEVRAARLLCRDHRSRLVGSLRQSRASAGTPIDPRDLRIPVDRKEVQLALEQLIEVEDLLISPAPVYCRGVVMTARIVGEGTGPLYAPRRRGELRERVGGALAALRGSI